MCKRNARHLSNGFDDFVQEPPRLSNPYLKDQFLQRCLQGMIPKEVSTFPNQNQVFFFFVLGKENSFGDLYNFKVCHANY